MIKDIALQFPQLCMSHINGRYTYLDSGATTLKPERVVKRLADFYSCEVSNVHRGAHSSSNQATLSYESTREKIAKFIGANSASEIIFTRGTTDSINLTAHIISSLDLNKGDEIVLTEMEHHSNIVPWQLISKKLNLTISYIPFDSNGDLIMSRAEELITAKTKVVSVCHVSNTLGTVNSIAELSKLAKKVGAYVVVDAAQSISALKVDVQKMNCDFLAFSGHKLFAPFGVGVLWGREDLLNSAEPYQGGGSMIDQVEKPFSTFLKSPQRFEAGTPNVAGVIGLGEAIDFVNEIGLDNIYKHERELLFYATDELLKLDENIKIIGNSKSKINVLSFEVVGVHPSDISHLLDKQGVAVRAGHHCTQLIFKSLQITGSVRATLSVYNTKEDIDYFILSLKKALEMLR